MNESLMFNLQYGKPLINQWPQLKFIAGLVMGLVMLLPAMEVMGQVPTRFNQQAVVRDTTGQVVANRPLRLRISLEQTVGGASVVRYREVHQVTTNANGLYTVEVGGGAVELGQMDSVRWDLGSVYLKTEVDPSGGQNYLLSSNRELLSVPYSILSYNGIGEIEKLNDSLFVRLINGKNYVVPLLNVNHNLLPVVNTDSFSLNGTYEAHLFGKLLNLRDGYELVRGFCIDTVTNPGIDKAQEISSSGLGSFDLRLRNLLPSKTYYFRAFVITTNGIGFGNELQLISNGPGLTSLPIVNTLDAINVNHHSAVIRGEVLDDGNLNLVSRGFVYSENPNPSLLNNNIVLGNLIGPFQSQINQLPSLDTIYYKAYAINSLGTSYGLEKSFITTQSSSLYIGQSFQGGTIFHLDSGGRSGLIVSDGIGAHYWGCSGQFIPGLLRILGSGQHNTTRIVSECPMANSVAKVCQDLVVNGYDDWYLGSSAEITILSSSISRGVTTTVPQTWTSSQFSPDEAIYRDLGGGTSHYSKSGGLHTRAIRSFSLDSTTSIPVVDSLVARRVSYFSADFQFDLLNNGNLTTGLGLCWSINPNPTILDSTNFVSSNLNGLNVLSAIDLEPALTYYVRGFAINKEGITYTNVVVINTRNIDTIISDSENNLYRCIRIGDQEWMIDNLKATKFRNGASIPKISSNSTWSSMSSPGYTVLSNDSLNIQKFGLLYNGFTILQNTPICPTGWRIPTTNDFADLMGNIIADGLGPSRKNLMKNYAWYPYNQFWPEPYLTNRSGWNSISSGFRASNGDFDSGGGYADYWTSNTETHSGQVYPVFRFLVHSPDENNSFNGHTISSNYGFSIRCMRNASQTFGNLPSVNTSVPLSIFSTGANLEGNVLSDGGSQVLERGFCLDTLSAPDLSDNVMSVGAGVGAFTSTYQNLTPNKRFYVRAYATNGVGTAFGNEFQFATPPIIPIGQSCNPPTILDIDGNVYGTVQIGSQCWMRENLRVTRFNNGDTIYHQPLQTVWSSNSNSPAWCWYNNNSTFDSYVGKLYNGYVSIDRPDVCPTGWHVPTNMDFNDLFFYVSNMYANAAAALMDTLTWGTNSLTTNSSGWAARYMGNRGSDGTFFCCQWGNDGPINQYYWIKGFDPWGTPLVKRFYGGSGSVPAADGWRESRNFGAIIRCIKN